MRICEVKDCEKPVRQNNMCGMHEQRLRRYGTTDFVGNRNHPMNKTRETKPGRRGYLETNTVDDIKGKAKKRGKEWTLEREEAFKLIISDCHYCGFKPEWPTTRVGIDRVDNAIGYITSNCVPCCFTCNSAKGVMMHDEFMAWIKRVYEKNYNP